MQIRLAAITYDSIVDGVGLRMVIWTQGCTHNCPSCHNPQTHPLDGGYLEDIEKVVETVNAYSLKSGVTISGGDPFEQPAALLELTRQLKQNNTNIWCFTGYTFEQIEQFKLGKEILENIDVLVDGKFVEALKSDKLKFKGSSNQRIIDVPKTLKENKIVLFMD